MSKRESILFSCAIVVTCLVSTSWGTVIFSDDFTGGFDPLKWSVEVTPGSPNYVQVDGGVLHNYFTGADTPQVAFAVSTAIDLPAGWTSITITGQWAFAIPVYGEMVMFASDADQPADYLRTSYSTYLATVFHASHTGSADYPIARSLPSQLTPFQFTITPTDWTFAEYRGGSWETLAALPTTLFAGTSHIQLKIGGWEYSYTSMQRTDYDDIVVDVIPEPASALLLLLGLSVVAARRRSVGSAVA